MLKFEREYRFRIMIFSLLMNKYFENIGMYFISNEYFLYLYLNFLRSVIYWIFLY